jgi:CheY-like chemotaxis protein
MDVRMQGVWGCEAAAHLQRDHPDVAVVLISAQAEHHRERGPYSCVGGYVFQKEDLRPKMLRGVWSAFERARKPAA